MATSDDSSAQPLPPKTFTSAERIAQLNAIDKDIATLLTSAGHAVKALTTAPPTATPSADSSADAHKAAFSDATATYFRLLSSVDVRLRRQIYALEEADIIAPAKDEQVHGRASEGKSGGAADGSGKGGDKSGGTGTGGLGLGGLDVGWLNGRGDTVGSEMEAELWAKARAFLARLEGDGGHGQTRGEDMAKQNGNGQGVDERDVDIVDA